MKPTFIRASSKTSSSSPSSDGSTSSSEDDISPTVSNTERIAKLYSAAATFQSLPKKSSGPSGRNLSKRANERLNTAILEARAALLRTQWNRLLDAYRRLENAVKGLEPDSLSWRLPMIARLETDIMASLTKATATKRDLPSDEAKALSVLKQRIPKDRHSSPFRDLLLSKGQAPILWQKSASSLVAGTIMDCVELALLNGKDITVLLSDLLLQEVPEELKHVSEALEWYRKFEDTAGTLPFIHTLDLSNNEIASLPEWLATALPSLKRINLEGNPIHTLPPFLPLFRHLEQLNSTPSPHTQSNAQVLASRAASLLASSPSEAKKASPPGTESLLRICLRVISAEDAVYLPPHLSDMHRTSYDCVSCKRCMLSTDDFYLASPLVERIVLFNPPMKMDCDRQTIRKTGYMVGGQEWHFCAACLYKHSVAAEGCECLVCREERRALAQEEGVRWARRKLVL